eukprot:scaffold982_cov169-Amphora_coffeaeformis.AAC.8
MDGQPFSVDLHHLPNPSASFFLKQKDEAIYQRHHHHHREPQETEQHQDSDHNNNTHKHKHLAPLTHKEYSLFRRGIFPDWEDAHCRDGGCFYTRQYWPPATLDRYWRNLVAGVVNSDGDVTTSITTTKQHDHPSSSLMLDATHIVGIRIDDKSKSKHPVYKIEIWLDTIDVAVRETVRNQALAVLLYDPDKRKNIDNNHEDDKDDSQHKLPALKLHWRKFGDIAPADGEAATTATDEGDDSLANKESESQS